MNKTNKRTMLHFVVWWCGVVVLWCCGVVVLWCCGVVVLWCCGAVGALVL
jgi:hypothetical protein